MESPGTSPAAVGLHAFAACDFDGSARRTDRESMAPGAYDCPGWRCRSAARRHAPPGERLRSAGFRVAATDPE